MMLSLLRCRTSIIRSSALVQASSSLSIGRNCAWPRSSSITEIYFRVFLCIYVKYKWYCHSVSMPSNWHELPWFSITNSIRQSDIAVFCIYMYQWYKCVTSRRNESWSIRTEYEWVTSHITTYPTFSDNFQSSFQSSKLRLVGLFSLKRGKRDLQAWALSYGKESRKFLLLVGSGRMGCTVTWIHGMGVSYDWLMLLLLLSKK